MSLSGKKLGLLISTPANHPKFKHAIGLAEAALAGGLTVYLYCIDEAVGAVASSSLQSLKERGVHLYACAYGAQRRNLVLSENATFAGLSVVNDLVTSTDRFVCF
jgi:sulfur relay (sulfurtransferase) complex TusBCD TusD component (DsrE family)